MHTGRWFAGLVLAVLLQGGLLIQPALAILLALPPLLLTASLPRAAEMPGKDGAAFSFAQTYFETVGDSDVIPSIFSLLQGPDGVLWVGTYAGLAYWDAAQQRFVMAWDIGGNPMRSTVNGMTRDSKGRIWIASHCGLWRVDAGATLLRGTRHEPRRKDSLKIPAMGFSAAVGGDRAENQWQGGCAGPACQRQFSQHDPEPGHAQFFHRICRTGLFHAQ